MLSFAWLNGAHAQLKIASKPRLDIAAVSGETFGTLSTSNSVYSDTSIMPSSIPAGLEGATVLLTQYANRGSTDPDTPLYQFNANSPYYAYVFHGADTTPDQLAGFQECDSMTMTVSGVSMQAYRTRVGVDGLFDPFAFYNNTTDGSTSFPERVIVLLPTAEGYKARCTAPTGGGGGGNPGVYRFTNPSPGSPIQEGTCATRGGFRRLNYDTSTSPTVDLVEGANTTATYGAGADYTVTGGFPYSLSFPTGGDGSLQAPNETSPEICATNNLTADKTVCIEPSNPSAGFTADTVNQEFCFQLVANITPSSNANFCQGGEPDNPADPGLDTCVSNAFYLDPCNGSDANAGTSTNAPWLTTTKLRTEKGLGNINGGDAVLVKNSCLITGGTFNFGDIDWGEFGSPVVFGTYGTPGAGQTMDALSTSDPWGVDGPWFAGNGTENSGICSFNGAGYFILHGWRCSRYSFSSGTHDFLVIHTQCVGTAQYGYPRTCYSNSGETTKGIFIENFGIDLVQRDMYMVHNNESEGSPTYDHFWFIGNAAVIPLTHNTGKDAEDCFDLTGAEHAQTDQSFIDALGEDFPTDDIKVIANACQMIATSFSEGINAGLRGMNGGHENRWYWVEDNYFHEGLNAAVHRGSEAAYTHVTGNVAWNDTPGNKEDMSFGLGAGCPLCDTEYPAEEVTVNNNLIIRTGTAGPGFMRLGGQLTSGVTVLRNIIRNTGTMSQGLFYWSCGTGCIEDSDDNYISPDQAMGMGYGSLAAWKSGTGLDASSSSGASLPTGISQPPIASGQAYEDPRLWLQNPTFDAYSTPTSAIPGSSCSDTYGAFDENGVRCGRWDEFTSAAAMAAPQLTTEGSLRRCGWAALEWPIVKEKMMEYGYTNSTTKGNCLEAWSL